MYTIPVVIVILCFTKAFCAPIESEDDVQLLDSFQSRGDEEFEFKFELSDGQVREEKIKYDDLDNGIVIKGSYNIELADGEMQTIYYISDIKGHRISINVPFSDDEDVKRPPPTRKPQNHVVPRPSVPLNLEEKKSIAENKIEEKTRKGRLEGRTVGGIRERRIESTTESEPEEEPKTESIENKVSDNEEKTTNQPENDEN